MVNNSTNINKNHLSPQLIEWWSTIPPISTKIWVKMRGDFYWYWWNCWPSLNELRWEVMFADIGGIDSTNINKNYLSPKLIEWWSTIPPISTKITSHLNSLSDGQQYHHSMSWSEMWFCCYWWNCWPSLNELKWEVIFIDIGGIVDHHCLNFLLHKSSMRKGPGSAYK
jgi:beta-lactamase superfamily II metal-dependent hydrolase